MITQRTGETVSRRTALAGIGAAGLGAALAAAPHAMAQDATPSAMIGHPLVGAWMVDRVPGDPTDMPTANIISSDGTVSDPLVGGAGVWQSTGQRTANFTLMGTITTPFNGYFAVRGSLEADSAGETAVCSYSSTVIATDGTVINNTAKATANYTRIKLEAQDLAGQPLPGFPAWKPAAPATPTP